MLSPFMTVAVLVVLWLIVVVPMVLRRSDERRRERSVDGFGRAMRALGRRAATTDADRSDRLDHPDYADPSFDAGANAGPDVFVPRQTRAHLAAPARRPVPAAQEALMYPPDRTEMSEARTQMLARRRRSLGTLIGGSVLFGIAALILGGFLWLLAGVFVLGLVGYLWFLRGQALRDRARRESRQQRAATRHPAGYDATEEIGRFEQAPESVVRIDDDDIDLHSMDTIDLTGLYNEELATESAQRRAS